MYGYDNLTPSAPKLALNPPEENKLRALERQVKNILVNSFGATEVYNYSFVGQAQIENLGLNTKSHVELLNPASEVATLMRRSLLPGLVNNLIDNLRFQEQLNFFEVGKVFIREESGENLRPGTDLTLPAQPLMMSGLFLLENIVDPVYQVKAIVEAILGNFNVKTNENINSGAPEWLHPERYLAYQVRDGEVLAEVGELHPRITTALDVPEHVGYWQINLSKLLEVANLKTSYHALSKFPSVSMDLAIVVPRKTLWKTVLELVFSTVPEYIREVSLFDEYKNDKIGVENKSLAFRVVYQADDRTLEAAEVVEWQKKIIDNLVKAVEARVRE
jgi:phenylalanyl-tRNA synthetase beta chain